MSRLGRWLRSRPRKLRVDVDDELSHHLEMRARELVEEEGYTPEAARHEARRRFGDLDGVRDSCVRIDASLARDSRRAALLAELAQDLRLALRQVRREPGFALVCVLTLALGIGANTAIFAVLRAVVLRPLPYEDPGRLVRVWESAPARGWDYFPMSAPNFLDYRERARGALELAAIQYGAYNLTGIDAPVRVEGARASANLLHTLGVEPVLGRAFTAAEDAPAAGEESHPDVVILGNGLWRQRFGGDEHVLGQTILLDGNPCTVVGVVPEDRVLLDGVDVLLPLNAGQRQMRSNHVLDGVGRLAPGVTTAAAEQELDAIAASLADTYPDSNAGFDARVRSLRSALVPDDVRAALYVLLGAVSLVLLIACGNVASLLLARATARRREIAVRAALGAGRGRIVRQEMTAAVALAVLGGAAGLLLARVSMGIFRRLDPTALPRFDELSVDGTVLLFAGILALLGGVVAGLVPALQVARGDDLRSTLQESSRTTAGGEGLLRRGLVVAQTALCVALLVGAGLLIRSLLTLAAVDPGLRTDDVLTLSLNVPLSEANGEETVALFREVVAELESIPGVERAGVSSALPYGDGSTVMDFVHEGESVGPQGQAPSAYWRLVTPGYFETLGIRTLAGKSLPEVEAPDGRPGVLISRTMAEREWPGEDPVGKVFYAWADPTDPFTVIGVVDDVRERSLETAAANVVYMPYYRFPMWSRMFVFVRADGDPLEVADAVRERIRAVAPSIPVAELRPLGDVVDDSLSYRRFNTVVLSAFAVLAACLAAAGVYGLMAFSVARRRNEIGIRMAIGARAGQVLSLVLGRGLRLVGAGIALGLLGAAGAARIMRGMLYGVSTLDPVTLVTVPALLALVAALACLAPARRAARVDPVRSLHEE